MFIQGPSEEMIPFLLYPSLFQLCKLSHFTNLPTKHAVREDSGIQAKKASHALDKWSLLSELLQAAEGMQQAKNQGLSATRHFDQNLHFSALLRLGNNTPSDKSLGFSFNSWAALGLAIQHERVSG